MSTARRDWLAIAAGTVRAASGVSFLVAPKAANRLWGGESEESPTAQLLLRSMGYRDALIGSGLALSGWRGGPATGWFLASAGADLADFVGGVGHHETMRAEQKIRGLGGAALGVALGVAGAVRSARSVPAVP